MYKITVLQLYTVSTIMISSKENRRKKSYEVFRLI
nr:MAG TPA: hypothetical protein [Caudoviricetes sp.]